MDRTAREVRVLFFHAKGEKHICVWERSKCPTTWDTNTLEIREPRRTTPCTKRHKGKYSKGGYPVTSPPKTELSFEHFSGLLCTNSEKQAFFSLLSPFLFLNCILCCKKKKKKQLLIHRCGVRYKKWTQTLSPGIVLGCDFETPTQDFNFYPLAPSFLLQYNGKQLKPSHIPHRNPLSHTASHMP